ITNNYFDYISIKKLIDSIKTPIFIINIVDKSMNLMIDAFFIVTEITMLFILKLVIDIAYPITDLKNKFVVVL
ncbi:7853_t:CDS:1, partial [Dentiscutata erythropus]